MGAHAPSTHNLPSPLVVDASWKAPTDNVGIGTLLVAEAMAMWSAVQQLYRLYYTNADEIKIYVKVIGVAKDIKAVATKSNFNFRHVPRKLIDVIDKLAKDARISNRPYVITWLNS
ncbi:hypothetical protein IGI04_038252 [Brassica rapa subsp. trilocularis]|uniref:RNase H type-1 domain-containing protein n=1 Tax=Brassica rapa subsp. trilocularis TaxID=1813537 RepID=A0ABQ7LJR0_BRACM|nr:hypothetical protein IGI04_038252 [Brassica rapa subsp. trilocularis]